MSTERLAFLIQCETAIDLGRMHDPDEFQRGKIEGLRQVYDWALAGEDVEGRVCGYSPPESYIRGRRQFLAGFMRGLNLGSEIVCGR